MSTLLEQPRAAERRVSSWLSILSTIWPAGLLLFAAAMKWKQLPVIERMGNDLLHNPWVAAAQILFEAALALWLVADAIEVRDPAAAGKLQSEAVAKRKSRRAGFRSWTGWSRPVALVTFALFACITAYRGIAGEDSCGCFGEFKVNPFLTLILDLSVIALLLASLRNGVKTISRPRSTAHDATAQRNPGIGVRGVVASLRETCFSSLYPMYLVAAMLAVVALTLWRMPSAPAANGTTTGIVRSGNLLIMEPDRWPGQSLPIMEYLLKDEGGRSERSADPGVPGMKDEKGRSLAIIYSNDCDHCRQAVPRFQASALRSSIPTLFIEMPPYASPGQELVRPSVSSGPITVARLTDQHEWFASTPIIIELNNGIIQRVAKGKAAENVDKWFGAVKDEPHTEATETTEKDPISLCPPCALCEASLSQLNVVRALQ